MSASISSVWPLPSTPAMPTISPRWMSKRDVVEGGPAAGVGDGRGPATDELDLVGDGGLAGLGGGQLAADHQLGQLRGR